MSDTYYSPHDLPRFGEVGENRPELFEAYQAWSDRVFAEGALTKKTKHLIATAVAHALQCPYCIDAHTQSSSGAGASVDELTEAIHVASVIRGGASLVHGLQALDALDRD
ncbi:MAG: arsenosugar biosynthesis-associated peroxidase-like protein [Planctomycetota bacterium JB042]